MKWQEESLPLPFRECGDIIHLTQDEHGKILVIDDGEYRELNFDSPFEQSCMRTRYPFQLVHQYTQHMLLVLGFAVEPKTIALLGLGGGSLLRTLHHLLPQCYFNVVELRQKVVDVAAEYFELPVSDRVDIKVDNSSSATLTYHTCHFALFLIYFRG
jgi:spermidine synthase